MSTSRQVLLVLVAFMAQLHSIATRTLYEQTSFDQNYAVVWGGDHVKYIDNGRLVQLSMDRVSGNFCGTRQLSLSQLCLFHVQLMIESYMHAC